MSEGLGRERWAHTSVLCALIANANRDPKKTRAFKPSDFNPNRTPREIASKEELSLLKEYLENSKGKSK